jgi:hypothetical protein
MAETGPSSPRHSSTSNATAMFVRFLAWLETKLAEGYDITEYEAAWRLTEYRRKNKHGPYDSAVQTPRRFVFFSSSFIYIETNEITKTFTPRAQTRLPLKAGGMGSKRYVFFILKPLRTY